MTCVKIDSDLGAPSARCNNDLRMDKVGLTSSRSYCHMLISPFADDTQNNQLMLPPAELKYLPDIEALVRGAGGSPQGRETLAKLIISENYMANLTPLVEIAEDLEDLPDLHRLCNIMKTLILFNDHAIIENAVRDDIILGVVGALECK